MPTPFKRLLMRELADRLPERLLPLLPSGMQVVGDIAILSLRPELVEHAAAIGEVVLARFPFVRTVCRKLGPAVGARKAPQVEVIAGEPRTETTHREGGCLFRLDVARVIFSKGNIRERQRMARVVREGEVVFDLFAGIGYFTIHMAKTRRPAVIYASDINPVALHYLAVNVHLNKVRGLVVPVLADCRRLAETLPDLAARVVMGFLPGTGEQGVQDHVIYPRAVALHHALVEHGLKPVARLSSSGPEDLNWPVPELLLVVGIVVVDHAPLGLEGPEGRGQVSSRAGQEAHHHAVRQVGEGLGQAPAVS